MSHGHGGWLLQAQVFGVELPWRYGGRAGRVCDKGVVEFPYVITSCGWEGGEGVRHMDAPVTQQPA